MFWPFWRAWTHSWMVRKAIYYITHWETWHWFAKYIVIGPVWLWLCLKARSFWFFTASNPTITFGGFTGESKSEIYKQLPLNTYPASICVSPSLSLTEISSRIDSAGLSFPLAVKPDIGMMGFMFRKVETLDQLRQYHEAMPADYLLQQWIEYPLEVSVFYYRHPGSRKGNITGFVKKEFMEVTGDGKSTLEELIKNYPRAQFRIKEMRSKHAGKLHEIIPCGERFCLSYALNLSRGGRLVSLEDEKDERLLKVFDDLSHYTGKFFYGRYDIKCSSIEDLKSGKNFSILEYNGSGAEAHHVYGNGNSFFKACRILIDHWIVLFNISAYNRRHGITPWTHNEGAEFTKNARRHFIKLRDLDSSFDFVTPTVNLQGASHGVTHASPVWSRLAGQKATA